MAAVTFFVNNPWVGYVMRSYLAMKQNIITKIQDPVTGIPEITDCSESNPFIKRVSIWCGINEQLGYYVDNKGRESFVPTARLFTSLWNLAQQYDYRVRGSIPSTGTVTFSFATAVPFDVLVPHGTYIQTATGIIFVTLSDVTILSGTTSIDAQVAQYTVVPLVILGQSNGSQNQIFSLPANVADGSIVVTVDINTSYNPVDTFVLSVPTDLVFKPGLNSSGLMTILFGDGVNGFIPPNTKNVSATYNLTQGSSGNVGAGLVTTINSVVTVPAGMTLLVNNTMAMVGGTDPESVSSLQKLIPLSLRTLYRAVTTQDYIDVTELAPGVAKAGVDYSCGKTVNIYIAPNGGGIASPTLCTNTNGFLDFRRMITTKTQVFSAGLVVIEYIINVIAYPNFFNTAIAAACVQTLEDFHNVVNQDIDGSVYISNIYAIIQAIPGVRHSDILTMRPIPYANPQSASYPVLIWTRTQSPTAASASYTILFTDPTHFNLVSNTSLIGQFVVGTQVVTPDITFTITGIYSSGNSYKFLTYASADSIILNEPSLPAVDPSFITINVTGGLS
jgi:uncharacterized phage protein gp47/JayE